MKDRTNDEKRANAGESTKKRERAILMESTKSDERAMRMESTNGNERATTRESTNCSERAKRAKSTMNYERSNPAQRAKSEDQTMSNKTPTYTLKLTNDQVIVLDRVLHLLEVVSDSTNHHVVVNGDAFKYLKDRVEHMLNSI